MNNSTEQENASSGGYQSPFGQVEIIISVSISITLSVFGIVANAITIVVISMSSKLKNTFYFLMLSLSVSDLVASLTSPLFIYAITWGYEEWRLSNFLCKAFWATDIWITFVTALHILMFSACRFISIQWPHRYRSYSFKTTKIPVYVVWTAILVIGFIPGFFFFGAYSRNRGSHDPDAGFPSCSLDSNKILSYRTYSVIAFSLFYYIPLVLVVAFSIGIVLKLTVLRKKRWAMRGPSFNKRRDPIEVKSRRREKRIIIQLGLIVGSFIVGYIPRTAFEISSLKVAYTYVPILPPPLHWWFSFLSYMVLQLRECFNPIFYNVSSRKMRNETAKTLEVFTRRLPCKIDQTLSRSTSIGTST